MPQKMDLWYSRLAQILLRDPRRLGDFAISFLMITKPWGSIFQVYSEHILKVGRGTV